MGLAAGLAVTLAVVAVAVSAYAGTGSQLRDQVDNSLQSLVHQVSPAPGGLGAPGGTAGEGPGQGDEHLGLDHIGGEPFGGPAGILTLVYTNGNSYVPPGQSYRIPVDARAKALAASGRGQYFTEMHVGGTHIRVLATGIGSRGALLAALPLTDVDHALSNELLLLVVIAAAGIGLAALLAVLVARTALAPIERFTRQTESIAADADRIEHQRLEVTGGDELARLARTFNDTLDALERSVRAQRNLVADASHELRTPITTIRANLQLMRDERGLSDQDREALRADVIDELDELTALVGDIVELARGSAPSSERSDVRLDGVVAEAVERTRRRAPQLSIEASLEPTLVCGEGERIARAVANVLDNARKWSPPHGVIAVELRDGALTVRDHGPGFHAQDLPFVFDRFHRAPDARSKPGSGLGLAIVRETAQAHGGFVDAANAAGGGAVVRIGFGPPLAMAPEPAAATPTRAQASPQTQIRSLG
jgi:two-component system, OmpR family, sensor histidine kinase MprB